MDKEFYTNKETRELIEQAHMAGQYNEGDGVEPSYSNAQVYANSAFEGTAKPVERIQDYICTGCGNKGWNANCGMCIPF